METASPHVNFQVVCLLRGHLCMSLCKYALFVLFLPNVNWACSLQPEGTGELQMSHGQEKRQTAPWDGASLLHLNPWVSLSPTFHPPSKTDKILFFRKHLEEIQNLNINEHWQIVYHDECTCYPKCSNPGVQSTSSYEISRSHLFWREDDALMSRIKIGITCLQKI